MNNVGEIYPKGLYFVAIYQWILPFTITQNYYGLYKLSRLSSMDFKFSNEFEVKEIISLFGNERKSF